MPEPDEHSRGLGRAALAPALLATGWLLLTLSWLFTTPPGAAPDESEHYIRAVSVGRLQFLGTPTSITPRLPQNDLQAAFVKGFNRRVTMPSGLAAPAAWFCTAADHQASGECTGQPDTGAYALAQPTYVGSYAPYPYILPGLATHLGQDSRAALFWARAADLVLSLALLIGGLWLLWDGGSATSLAGALLAVTPMVIFTSAVLSSSAAELASAFSVAAAVIRLWRQPTSRAGLAALGAAGFVLAVGRPFGPAWVLGALALLWILLGRDGRRAARGRWLAAVLTVVAVGVAMNIGWQAVVTRPSPQHLADLLSFLGPAIASVPETLGEAIGVFGWDDTLMPRPLYGAWGFSIVALLAAALLLGKLREVRVLEFLLLGSAALIVGLTAFAVLPTGFAAQGRYVLPTLMVLILFAGEVVHRNRKGRGGRRMQAVMLPLAIVAATVQLAAWYTSAHRYSVGTSGPWFFFPSSQWQPPLGWVLWTVVATVGAVAIALSAALPGSTRSRDLTAVATERGPANGDHRQ